MSVHVLYRIFDSDHTLLYVGITANPPKRFKNHKFTRPWWNQVANIGIEQFPTREALCDAERKAIQREYPLYNVHNNTQAGRESRLADPEVVDNLDDLCECDFCDFADECHECDICAGRTGEYVLIEHRPAGAAS